MSKENLWCKQPSPTTPQEIGRKNWEFPPQPQIKYDKSLHEEKVPYTVTINPKECGEFLRELGLPDERIKELKIIVTRKPPLAYFFASGMYNPIKNEIKIYTDNIWSTYKWSIMAAKRIALASQSGHRILLPTIDRWISFRGVLTTKRLYEYLQKVPPERSITFAEKLLSKAMSKRATVILLHESAHSKERRNKILWTAGMATSLANIGTGLMLAVPLTKGLALIGIPPGHEVSVARTLSLLATFPIFYHINPMEVNARKAETKYRKDPRWQNLISFTPKKST